MGSRWRARSTSTVGANQVLLSLTLLATVQWTAMGNKEGDALLALRQELIDPAMVLQSWDPTLPNPCTWLHITCNLENHVTRVDLGNASLSGSLAPELGELSSLQYLEMFGNNISGAIPSSLGNLWQLVSLDLYQNIFTGSIPASLGQLSQLRVLRLNNNSLSGEIPESLTGLANLQILDLSYNYLSGVIPVNGSFAHFSYASFEGNPYLHYVLAPAPAPRS